MQPLFDKEPQQLNLPDSDIIYYPDFMDKTSADNFFILLKNNCSWQQDDIKVMPNQDSRLYMPTTKSPTPTPT